MPTFLESVWFCEPVPGLPTTRLEAGGLIARLEDGMVQVRYPGRTVLVPLSNVAGMVVAEEKPQKLAWELQAERELDEALAKARAETEAKTPQKQRRKP